MCHSFDPPFGIPIPKEIHEQFPADVKKAWKTFHEWWQEANASITEGLVDSKSMPTNVRAAYDLINKTPIPGYDGATGADSCYMIGVKTQMSE